MIDYTDHLQQTNKSEGEFVQTQLKQPSEGDVIQIDDQGKLMFPTSPLWAYIEEDGIGVDITPASGKGC